MAQSDATNYFRDLFALEADSSLSIAEKINQAIAVGRKRLELPHGVLSYTGAGEYEIIESDDMADTYVAGAVHNLQDTWCRHVVDNRETLAIANAGESTYADDTARETTQLQCYIGAPVLVDGETYGTLCYGGETPREMPFTEDEKRFVQLLSRWIGNELEREKHHQALDQQKDRLNEFAGVLTHDLRNPLTTAKGYTELAAESASEPEAEHLETVIQSLDRMETLIGETLALARDGNDVGEREPVALKTIAHAAWETVSPDDATLVVKQNRSILADRSRLQQLLENLFRNVDEHCGSDVTVTVQGTDDGFTVADDGPGLPEDLVESLFDGTFDSARVGLGLLIVERVVSGHGWHGTVEVDNGTRFVISGVGRVTDRPSIKR